MEIKATLMVLVNEHGKHNQVILEPTVSYQVDLNWG